MPERKNTFRVAADEVQGEGSWVDLRRLSWEQQRRAQRLLAEHAGGELPRDTTKVPLTVAFLEVNSEFTREMLASGVAAWNWVDDQGQALPLPAAGGMVLLSDQEVAFLVVALQPKPPPKN